LKTARRFTIKGRVQGVFFRESTRRVAESLNITGHAINLSNGDVEVLACGTSDAIDELSTWLTEGPRMASVTDVTSEETDVREATSFTTG
jgi:acylphosphatase